MTKIEVLYPETCNLFGDMFNIKLLEQSINDVEIINTNFTDEPAFVTQNVDMIYLAPMTERTQEEVIKKLEPYKARLEELINKNTVMLFTGNAFEILGKYIENEDGTKVQGLGIMDLYSKRDMMHRYSKMYLGEMEIEKGKKIKILGFKAQFSMTYGDNQEYYAFNTIRGDGINKESKFEGIRLNNCFGTYILGPILVNNPFFAKYILRLLNVKDTIAFEDIAIENYQRRLEEFENPATKYE